MRKKSGRCLSVQTAPTLGVIAAQIARDATADLFGQVGLTKNEGRLGAAVVSSRRRMRSASACFWASITLIEDQLHITGQEDVVQADDATERWR